MDYKKILVVIIIALGSFGVYKYFELGLHTMPDLPDGAWAYIFNDEMKVIMVDIPNEKDKRKYILTPMADIPSWFEDAWSFCRKPTDEEEKQINKVAPPDRGMRLDAFCSIDADGEIIPTGIIYSVPRL